MSSKLRIIGYGRESTRDQARYGFNLDDQEKKIRKYVDIYYENDTYEFRMIREEGASAKSLDRPKMNEILTLVKHKQVDVIVIHNLDRLTRRVKDLATLLEMFEAYSVSLISITEKIDTKTPMGRFFIFLIVLIAQWEQDTISDRTKRGIEESARQGNYALPGAPFGYLRNPEDNHKLIVNDEEAKVVIRIFESIAYKDYSIRSLRNELKNEKAGGRSWTEFAIEKILNNKIYYGTFSRFGKEYDNHTVPIIDRNLFELAHIRMTGRSTVQHKEYVYNNMVVCQKCGNVMHNHSSKSKNGKVHMYYQCTCCHIQVSEKEINMNCEALLTKELQKEKYFNDIEELKCKYDELADILDRIPADAIKYNSDYSYLAGLLCRKQEDMVKLDRCLKTLANGQEHTSFLGLPYSEKRELLQRTIETIVYDGKSKSINIRYLNS